MATTARLDEPHETGYQPAAERSVPPLRVLIVDDDRDTANTMAMLLRCWGLEPVVVGDGLEALQAIQADCPDLILLDLAMPGMDGLELAKRLRQLLPPKSKCPFLVAISGYGDATTCQRSRDAGIDLHLVKPVDPAELQRLLVRFQNVVMQGVEQNIPLGSRYAVPIIPTLKYASDLAIFKQCLQKAREIRCKCEELRPQIRLAYRPEEQIKRREEYCNCFAQLLDESNKISFLLRSFQNWEIYA
jgi:CheY-like chemotaxis protein